MLTAIGPFSIDMYLPAFPDIAKNLHTTVAQVTLIAIQFFYWYFCRAIIIWSIAGALWQKETFIHWTLHLSLASIGCALAASVNALIVLRLLQALGGCVGMVAARAMVRDLFEVKENAKIFSTLMLVVAVSPIIAPTLGGYITAVLGWRFVFVMLIIVDLIIIAGIYFLLPESKKPDPDFSLRPLPLSKILQALSGIRSFILMH